MAPDNGKHMTLEKVAARIGVDVPIIRRAMVMARFDLSEQEWEIIAPLLPNKPLPLTTSRHVFRFGVISSPGNPHTLAIVSGGRNDNSR